MGIMTCGARLLCNLKRKTDIDYSKVLMLGRQNLVMNKRQIKQMIRDYADVLQSDDIQDMFCEKLFSALNAKEINSLDMSEYEGATVIHDLNQAISSEWEETYTCIVDGGTTEHLYDFPQAMRNIMRMLKVGGYYIGLVPSNNYNGHGFYQFAPMLYIQLFCRHNHFELKNIYFWHGAERHVWELNWLNLDPTSRIEINGNRPSLMYIVAKKTAPTPEKIVLQQRDYREVWKGVGKEAYKNSKMVEDIKRIARRVLPFEKQFIIKYYYKLLLKKEILSKIKL